MGQSFCLIPGKRYDIRKRSDGVNPAPKDLWVVSISGLSLGILDSKKIVDWDGIQKLRNYLVREDSPKPTTGISHGLESRIPTGRAMKRRPIGHRRF